MTGPRNATMQQRMSVTWMEVRSTFRRIPGARRLTHTLYSPLLMILRSVYGDAYRQVVFRAIWISNLWGDAESRSGTGSNLRETGVLRKRLASLLEHLAVRRILDVPCGDFHWMKEVQFPAGLVYEGGDIVEQIVNTNHNRYGCATRSFRTIDLLRDPLPAADLILCRDCLVHFSFIDIFAAVSNLKRSGSKYLLTTHYASEWPNDDIRTGRWRPLNLTRPPFNFPPPLFVIDEESTEADGRYKDKHLALWRLEDLPESGQR
jgi:hypothetical protein